MSEPEAPRGSVKALAAQLGVSRRRISKWRLEGAPAGFDQTQWHQWLTDTGRTKILERLTPTTPLDGAAPETAAAASGVSAATAVDDNKVEWNTPAVDASPAVWEKHWKARANRQAALNAERKAREDSRDLIPATETGALLQAMAAAQLEALGDTVWLTMRPHLDGVSDTLRKTLRTAHDQALIAIRAKVVVILRDKFLAITNPPAKPA